jgi:hypothetical protein
MLKKKDSNGLSQNLQNQKTRQQQIVYLTKENKAKNSKKKEMKK